jgi:hypothetical protein
LNDQKKFDKPLDKWVEETKDLEIVTPKYSKKGVEFVKKTIEAKENVVYTEPTNYRTFCARGEHHWECEDPHNYIFRCSKCSLKRKVFPITYDFKDGQLINRRTGELI